MVWGKAEVSIKKMAELNLYDESKMFIFSLSHILGHMTLGL